MRSVKASIVVLVSVPMALAASAAFAQVDTELGGSALAGYPHFNYVRALNTDVPVQVALDPTRFPAIVGDTCNIHVVNDKTAAQWLLDPALTDVTPGGALAVTFTLPPPAPNNDGSLLSPITANIFTVAGPGELPSSAGTTNLGRPYDVVVDCNQNGILDAGDYIDGRNPDRGGVYVVHDLTLAGSLPVTSVNYSVAAGTVPAGFQGQRTYYPSGIASMGLLPLIVISHGNGHQYTWYDYLQSHLASYGYIVMSHQNNTGAGIAACSFATLQHTDAIIREQATIAGGVLNGHIDVTRIMWIGHSRGGEGVARAYDRITDLPPSYTPAFYTVASIRLVSSIAPTDFLGLSDSNPHDVNYHLFYGGADGDVSGTPGNDIADSFNVYERATGVRSAHYIQGVGHNEFNCCGFADATGPALIGRPAAQTISRGYYLALAKRYLENNVPAKDFLWRQYEQFRPIGTLATAVLDLEYYEPASTGKFVIDDYQTQPSSNVSSSGGAVTFNVANVFEGLMNDTNADFTWPPVPADPMNGMTRGRTNDTTNGVVFDAVANTNFMEWSIVAGQRDFSSKSYLSFRAAQGTRHPLTIADLGDLNWTVTLRDGAGRGSTIGLSAFGGGVEEPYQRTGAGTGAGWQNEFETTRIRLTDFLNDGSNLDLTDIVSLRFDSPGGRIALDDIEVTTDP